MIYIKLRGPRSENGNRRKLYILTDGEEILSVLDSPPEMVSELCCFDVPGRTIKHYQRIGEKIREREAKSPPVMNPVKTCIVLLPSGEHCGFEATSKHGNFCQQHMNQLNDGTFRGEVKL